jgi:hypothetical protein
MTPPLAEALEATLSVTNALDTVGVQHFVGGSLASSLLGEPRSTQDVDVVAAMNAAHVEPFARAIESSFFVDRDMAADAIAHRSEFNVVHLPTMFKVDVFVPGLDLMTRRQLARARRIVLDEAGRSLVVASPEDVVAQKLRWFRLGGDVSDRQWRDVLGVLKITGPSIDITYLEETCELLEVGDLLRRAREEAR